MLTNTTITPRDDAQISATTIAIEDAERATHKALEDITRLADSGQITASEAAELEAETLARFIAHAHKLERDGEQLAGPTRWARYEERAARRRAAALDERRRSPRLSGLSAPERALRERQMCVVSSGRITDAALGRLLTEEDDEALALRRELADAGLL